MKNKYFSFKAVLGYSWHVVKANFWFFVGVGLIWLTITSLLSLLRLVTALLFIADDTGYLLFGASFLMHWVIKLALMIGLVKIALRFFSEETPGMGTLFNTRGCFWRYFTGKILYGLVLYAGMFLVVIPYSILEAMLETAGNDILIYGMMALLAIPGIIGAITFGFYGYFIIDQNLGPIAALKASSRMTRGVKWRLFCFEILCALIGLLGFFCLTIGLLAALAIILIANTLVYRKLLSQTPELAELGIAEVPAFEITAGPFKRKTPVFGGIFVLIIFTLGIISIFAVWNMDAEPIPNDYTVADLRSAPAEYNDSYEVLLSLADGNDPDISGRPAIGLTAQDVNTIDRLKEVILKENLTEIAESIKADAAGINQAWTNAQKGRDIIDQLNTFPEIADLTEPGHDTELLGWGQTNNLRLNLRSLFYLYKVHIYLETENGNDIAAVNELIKFDSVFRKFSVNSRSIITKLTCTAGMAYNIMTANYIANNPKTSRQALDLLAEHFQPHTKEQASMRNPLISEYLAFKKLIHNEENYMSVVVIDLMKQDPEAKLSLFKIAHRVFLRPYSSIRLCRNLYDLQLDKIGENEKSEQEQLSVWPRIYPDFPKPPDRADLDLRRPYLYLLYNTPGYALAHIMLPAFDKINEINTRLKVHDDLLKIVLNKRMGNEINLKARAYSDEYTIDLEKKKIISPGPDCKIYSGYDITLPINPDFFSN